MKEFQSLGKSLSKAEQKKITGGVEAPDGSCSYTWQGSDGTWHTENGSCENYVVWGGYIPYCNTTSHQQPTELTSNGGVSRCGAPVWG